MIAELVKTTALYASPVAFLQRLVEIESLSGREGEAVRYLVSEMAAAGMAARVDGAGNAVGVRELPDAAGRIEREIVLLGHIDTVPGQLPVKVVNGRLYGRGAVDAKGPLAALVQAAIKARLAPGTRLVVIGAVEEESATSKGAHYIAGLYRPDWCIVGEPSGWDGVTLGYKGRLLLDYNLCRPMAHTAGPVEGVAETAVAFWGAVQAYTVEYNRGRDRLFDQSLPSLRHIRTDDDGLTQQVTAQIGLRLPPDFDETAFTAWAAEAAGPAHLRVHGHEPAHQCDRRSPLARAFGREIAATGHRPHFKVKTGTSDMNVVAPQWGCPIVAYGPGDSRLDHTPEENVVIADYLRAIEVVVRVLEGEWQLAIGN